MIKEKAERSLQTFTAKNHDNNFIDACDSCF